jgi:acylphosphatase
MADRRLCRRLRARGRVQAVGFRDWLSRRAGARGVDGWVRNLADGSLEAVLAGPDDAVEPLIDAVRRGPPGSRVDSFDVEDEPDDPGPGFRVL